MFNKIKRLYSVLYVVSTLITVFLFVVSAILFEQYPWVSNLLMGIGASFLASILFATFSETTRKKYVILSAEAKAKKETTYLYMKGIDLGWLEAKEAYESHNYERALSWIGYFYEKILSTSHSFEGIQQYEGKLKKDVKVNSFISEVEKLHSEFLEIEEHFHDSEDKKAIAEEALRNMGKCYVLYGSMIQSALHDATEIEMINNKYYFDRNLD